MTDRALGTINNRLAQTAGQVTTTAVTDETNVVQQITFTHNNEQSQRDGVPSIQHFGFVSSAPTGTDFFTVSPGGNPNYTVAVGSNHRESRPKILTSGETMIYDNRGQFVHIKADGSISVKANSKVLVTAPEVRVVASTKVILDTPQTELTGHLSVAGNMAIQGVSTMQGSLTAQGTITSTNDVIGGGKSLKTHTHGNVQNGAGNTGAPN